jgi:hypothetical protein
MKFRKLIFILLLALWAVPAFGQGCAMCYSSASAAGSEGQKAISKGVMVLLVPPMGFMTLGLWLAFRYSKSRDRESIEVPAR